MPNSILWNILSVICFGHRVRQGPTVKSGSATSFRDGPVKSVRYRSPCLAILNSFRFENMRRRLLTSWNIKSTICFSFFPAGTVAVLRPNESCQSGLLFIPAPDGGSGPNRKSTAVCLICSVPAAMAPKSLFSTPPGPSGVSTIFHKSEGIVVSGRAFGPHTSSITPEIMPEKYILFP